MKPKLTLALVALMTSTAFAAFQAPLPEFKNEKQLAEWRAEKAAEAASHGYAAEETAFYTGKPYLASSGDYAFKYRIYNPALSRWTSEDPSGYPDGANNSRYVIAPNRQFDPLGLRTVDGGTSPLPQHSEWTYGGIVNDPWTGWIWESRVQLQYLSWETAANAVVTGAPGDSVTATASLTLTNTETWGWTGNGSFQVGVTENIKFTVGGGYGQGGSSGASGAFGGSSTKNGLAGVAWTADILIATTQLMQQVRFLTPNNGGYSPVSGWRGNWHDDKIMDSGAYTRSYGFKWRGAE